MSHFYDEEHAIEIDTHSDGKLVSVTLPTVVDITPAKARWMARALLDVAESIDAAGFVIVPKEPTVQMLGAIYTLEREAFPAVHGPVKIWQAMIEAAAKE